MEIHRISPYSERRSLGIGSLPPLKWSSRRFIGLALLICVSLGYTMGLFHSHWSPPGTVDKTSPFLRFAPQTTQTPTVDSSETYQYLAKVDFLNPGETESLLSRSSSRSISAHPDASSSDPLPSVSTDESSSSQNGVQAALPNVPFFGDETDSPASKPSTEARASSPVSSTAAKAPAVVKPPVVRLWEDGEVHTIDEDDRLVYVGRSTVTTFSTSPFNSQLSSPAKPSSPAAPAAPAAAANAATDAKQQPVDSVKSPDTKATSSSASSASSSSSSSSSPASNSNSNSDSDYFKNKGVKGESLSPPEYPIDEELPLGVCLIDPQKLVDAQRIFELASKRVLIIGVNSLLGSNLVRYLMEFQQLQVFGVDDGDRSVPASWLDINGLRTRFMRVDINNPRGVAAIFETWGMFQYILHVDGEMDILPSVFVQPPPVQPFVFEPYSEDYAFVPPHNIFTTSSVFNCAALYGCMSFTTVLPFQTLDGYDMRENITSFFDSLFKNMPTTTAIDPLAYLDETNSNQGPLPGNDDNNAGPPQEYPGGVPPDPMINNIIGQSVAQAAGTFPVIPLPTPTPTQQQQQQHPHPHPPQFASEEQRLQFIQQQEQFKKQQKLNNVQRLNQQQRAPIQQQPLANIQQPHQTHIQQLQQLQQQLQQAQQQTQQAQQQTQQAQQQQAQQQHYPSQFRQQQQQQYPQNHPQYPQQQPHPSQYPVSPEYTRQQQGHSYPQANPANFILPGQPGFEGLSPPPTSFQSNPAAQPQPYFSNSRPNGGHGGVVGHPSRTTFATPPSSSSSLPARVLISRNAPTFSPHVLLMPFVVGAYGSTPYMDYSGAHGKIKRLFEWPVDAFNETLVDKQVTMSDALLVMASVNDVAPFVHTAAGPYFARRVLDFTFLGTEVTGEDFNLFVSQTIQLLHEFETYRYNVSYLKERIEQVLATETDDRHPSLVWPSLPDIPFPPADSRTYTDRLLPILYQLAETQTIAAQQGGRKLLSISDGTQTEADGESESEASSHAATHSALRHLRARIDQQLAHTRWGSTEDDMFGEEGLTDAERWQDLKEKQEFLQQQELKHNLHTNNAPHAKQPEDGWAVADLADVTEEEEDSQSQPQQQPHSRHVLAVASDSAAADSAAAAAKKKTTSKPKPRAVARLSPLTMFNQLLPSIHPHLPIDLQCFVALKDHLSFLDTLQKRKSATEDKVAYMKGYAKSGERDEGWLAEMSRYIGAVAPMKAPIDSKMKAIRSTCDRFKQFAVPPPPNVRCEDHKTGEEMIACWFGGRFSARVLPNAFFQTARWLYNAFNRKPAIIVAGSHRSGTTFLREVLSTLDHVHVVEEPMHRRFVCTNLDGPHSVVHTHVMPTFVSRKTSQVEPDTLACRWYARLHEDMSTAAHASTEGYFDDLFALRRISTTPDFNNIQPYAGRILIKDPFMSMSLDWFPKRFAKDDLMKVILTVKNPLHFADSLVKGGFGWVVFSFDDLTQQPQLLQTLGPDLAQQVWNVAQWQHKQRSVSKFASKTHEHAASVKYTMLNAPLLWNVVYSQILDYKQRHPDVLSVRNEDFIAAPHQTLEKVMTYLDEPYLPHSRSFVTGNIRPHIDFGYVTRLPIEAVEDIYLQTREISQHFYKPDDWYDILHPSDLDYFVAKGYLPAPPAEWKSRFSRFVSGEMPPNGKKLMPRVPPIRNSGITPELIAKLGRDIAAEAEKLQQIRKGQTNASLL